MNHQTFTIHKVYVSTFGLKETVINFTETVKAPEEMPRNAAFPLGFSLFVKVPI